MRLSEQVRVLKDEVRRLENNKEREQHAENLEYLKNVFIKVMFCCLKTNANSTILVCNEILEPQILISITY